MYVKAHKVLLICSIQPNMLVLINSVAIKLEYSPVFMSLCLSNLITTLFNTKLTHIVKVVINISKFKKVVDLTNKQRKYYYIN